MTNPLLQSAVLPAFGKIRPEHAEPAVDTLLARNRASLAALLAANSTYTWNNLIAPLEENEDQLHRAFSPIAHLHGVADSEELRAAYNACLPKLTEYGTELGQHEGLFAAYRQIADSAEFQQLSTAQRKAVELALREFRLSGIGLPGEARERFKQIQQKLSASQTKFEENLLDATDSWTWHTENSDKLRGLPDSAVALAAQAAERKQMKGWLFTLHQPSYVAVMQYAEDADFRRSMYEAYVTRASDRGPDAGRFDNGGLMEEILALRREEALLLGFADFTELSLVRKMARTPEAVLDFMHGLVKRARPVAQAEFAELLDYARSRHGAGSLDAWDVPFYSEKLRQERFDFSDEDLRPYFPLHTVLSGMFEIVRRLYGIRISERTGVETWHPDVRFFEVTDETGIRGAFYLDACARPGKRSGAWMDDCVNRRRSAAGVQHPVAYLTCNFMPPVAGKPSLLTHDEVVTLFHEFGHGLHHMLTRIDYAEVSGINGVPWDAVELPSQFMENWCWERESLDLVARHYKTGAPLPDALLKKLRDARHFHAGMHMARQLELGLFDFELHRDKGTLTASRIQQVLDSVRARTTVVPVPDFNRYQHGFSHIFAGGYAAGYYSYLWAEVLSADAFSRFEETGIFDPDSGRRFLHCILEQGGSRDPMDLFIEFRGREPSIEALLRHSGIVPVPVSA